MHPVNPASTTTTTTTTARPKLARAKSTLSLRSDNSTATAPTAASKARSSPYTPPPTPTPAKLLFGTRPSQPPTAAVAAPAAARQPLRPRDRNQNVLSLTATRTSITSRASRMPVGERPRQPQLSAAAAKSVNRTPLTPKIAAKGLPVVTPLGKRTQNPSVAASQPYTKDDQSTTTPVAASGGPFLSSNITPRSGHRQNRVDSANTTPSGTPNPERNNDGFDSGRLSGVSSLAYDGPRQSSPEVPSDSSDSKFFYASDAKNPPQTQYRPQPTLSQKPNTFFYANAASNNDSKRRLSPPAHTPFTALSPTPEPSTSKFFYANGTPDMPQKGGLVPSSSASTVSSASRGPAKRPSTSHSTMGLPTALPQRPLSPVKGHSTPSAQPLRSNGTLPIPQNRTKISSPPTLAPVTGAARSRGVTIDAAPKPNRGHVRGGSVPTIEPLPGPRLTLPISASPEPVSPPLSPGLSQPAMTMASILQAVEDLADNDSSADGDNPVEPQSPTKSIHSSDAISELVTNARRERKVQDLEITNASLEAINRTLERQLRKQTAELRRYRRLSRSGRISLASAPSSRVTSAAMTEPPEDLSDLEEEEDSYMSEEPDSLEDSDLSDAESIPGADPLSPSEKMVARRKRDEKRLQLDLTKHQELLIDSQKMNQSLKRCLNWTEMLIKEGQKALEYRVRVSDVELGGKVLAPPDEEDEDISFLTDTPLKDVASVRLGDDPQVTESNLEPPWVKGPQDRDSGIELPSDTA